MEHVSTLVATVAGFHRRQSVVMGADDVFKRTR